MIEFVSDNWLIHAMDILIVLSTWLSNWHSTRRFRYNYLTEITKFPIIFTRLRGDIGDMIQKSKNKPMVNGVTLSNWSKTFFQPEYNPFTNYIDVVLENSMLFRAWFIYTLRLARPPRWLSKILYVCTLVGRYSICILGCLIIFISVFEVPHSSLIVGGIGILFILAVVAETTWRTFAISSDEYSSDWDLVEDAYPNYQDILKPYLYRLYHRLFILIIFTLVAISITFKIK